jgi:hypothetical protein
MKPMKMKAVLSILCMAIFSSNLMAQSLTPTVVSSGGSYHSAGGYTLSATIGEIAVTTLKTASLILTQGFQQPYDIGVGIKETGLDWSITTYPNPVSEYLNIRFDLEEPLDLNVEIMDISGRKQMIRELYYVTRGEIVTFNMTEFSRGVYLVRISTPDQRVQKVYKIQKF